MKERLAQFLAAENISRNDFANQIGVQRSNITHILDGRNKPSFDFIEKMLTSYPQINADWLILGHGDMYKKPVMGSLFPPSSTKPLDNASHKTAQVNEPESSNLLPPVQERIKEKAAVSADSGLITALANVSGKQVERIIVLYTDKTFDTYQPS